MSGAVLLHLITYAALAIFVVVVAVRFFRISAMPMHLRWELYPVAHEGGEKAKYGGSRLEEIDWWTKPKETSRFNELRAMIPEMTFLVALFEHNRKLWWWSFPFHFGLYILTGMLGLIVLGAVMGIFGATIAADSTQAGILGSFVYHLTQVAAVLGLTLATVGAAGLLHRRLHDPDLKDYTSPAAILNLVLFLAVFAVAWITFIFVDTGFVLTRSYIQSLITLNISASTGSFLLSLEILLAVLLIAYIPMTHMSHFFIKWFTYHKIRWDDEPSSVGGAIEKKVMEQVQYPVSWAAPHINADGKKNWVDIATEEIAKEEKK
ncbi:MAG: respiratory nitrate reductase subunit gamma [bacterium]